MDTNPATEVSPEAQLEAIFARREQPAKEAPEAKPEAEEPDEPDEPVAAKEDESPDEGEEEAAEVEIDGKTYRVPAELKDKLLFQKDYTQKTQAVAEQRKELEERKAALQQTEQAQRAAFEKRVEIKALETQLKAYEQIDWASLAESDPAHAMKLNFAREALLKQQAKAHDEMTQVEGQARELSASQRQQALERDAAILQRDIKGWGPELRRSIAESGKGYGYTEAELQNVTARDIKVLHKAHLWDQLQASKAATTKKVLDVKPVTVKAARSAPQTQANQSLDDARARQRKSGSKADTESYLERLFASKGRK